MAKMKDPVGYTKNSKVYKFPMTPAEEQKFNKLYMSPKTATTLFTLPKGAEKLSAVEKKQIQSRRIADRKRTLGRAEFIIRRETGVKTSEVKPSKSTSKPKAKPKAKTSFGIMPKPKKKK
jgi:NaMN:DMB phosphoribosyltransferase